MLKNKLIKGIVVSSLLNTLPLSLAHAGKGLPVEFPGNNLNLSIDPTQFDNLDDMQVDAEGDVKVNLPFAISGKIQYRINETIKSFSDVKIDEAYFWQTIEGLTLSKKIYVTVEVGKLKDVGFGADGTEIGSTVLPRRYNDTLVQSTLDLRGRTGIKLSTIGDLLPDQLMAVQVLRRAMLGLTVSFFDPKSQAKPTFKSYQDLSGFAVQKIGKALGVEYQASYIKNDTEDFKDRRWSVSAQKCVSSICFSGEHMDLSESAASSYQTQDRVALGTRLHHTNLAAQYEHNKAKENLSDAVAIPRGDVASIIAEHQLNKYLALGASIGRDIDKKENIYGVNMNVSLDKNKQKTHAGMFKELAEEQARKDAELLKNVKN